MAMNAATLATEIETKLQGEGFVTNGEHPRTKQMCKAIAEAVVEHITANAVSSVAGGSTHTHTLS